MNRAPTSPGGSIQACWQKTAKQGALGWGSYSPIKNQLKYFWAALTPLEHPGGTFSKQDPVLIQKLEWAYPRNTVRSLHEGSCWLQRAYLIPHCRIREMKSMHGCELGKKEQSKLLRLNAPLEIQILLTEFLHVEKKWQIIKMIFLYFIFSTSSDKLRSSYFSITINRHSSSPYPYQTQPKYILLAHFFVMTLKVTNLTREKQTLPHPKYYSPTSFRLFGLSTKSRSAHFVMNRWTSQLHLLDRKGLFKKIYFSKDKKGTKNHTSKKNWIKILFFICREITWPTRRPCQQIHRNPVLRKLYQKM